jgi:hypothetical protein
MAVPLPRTETALAECREHLTAAGAADPAIDSAAVSAYLASHIAIVLCGEVESIVAAYFDELIEAAECDPVVTKLAKARKGTTRSAKVNDIGDALDRVGHDVRLKFEAEVATSVRDEGVARLGNAVGIRDGTAHDVAPGITFAELERAADAARGVLESVRVALGLPTERAGAGISAE